MNGQAQRLHTRKTDALAAGIADTQAAVIERFEEVEARMQQFRDRLHETRGDLAAVIDNAGWAVAQCKDHGRHIDTLLGDVADLKHDDVEHERVIRWLRPLTNGGTFWERLRWLMTGR